MKVFCGLMIAINVLSSSCVSYFILFPILPHAEGALEFTRIPYDPTYVLKGQNAALVWEYRVDDREKELKGIVWSVAEKVTGKHIVMFWETKSGNRGGVAGIPLAYKGRFSIKQQATLVIENVTLDDSTTFYCTLRAETLSGSNNAGSAVQLVVTGYV